MNSGDDYRTVTVRIRHIAQKSIVVDNPPSRGEGTCIIARSLLHYTDDRLIEVAELGEEVTIRLREWKAEELGLAG